MLDLIIAIGMFVIVYLIGFFHGKLSRKSLLKEPTINVTISNKEEQKNEASEENYLNTKTGLYSSKKTRIKEDE